MTTYETNLDDYPEAAALLRRESTHVMNRIQKGDPAAVREALTTAAGFWDEIAERMELEGSRRQREARSLHVVDPLEQSRDSLEHGLFLSICETARLYCRALGGQDCDALRTLLQGLAESLAGEFGEV